MFPGFIKEMPFNYRICDCSGRTYALACEAPMTTQQIRDYMLGHTDFEQPFEIKEMTEGEVHGFRQWVFKEMSE